MSKTTPKLSRLDEGMTFVGILIGMIIGAVAMLFRVKERGEVTRKNITQFGAGTIEQDISTSLEDAKQQAKQRASED